MARSPRPVRDRIIDAALKLAADTEWRTISLGDIARATRISLAGLQENFQSKTGIVAAIMAKTDAAVLSGTDPSAESEPLRDRLLDAVMRRLDVLQPHKKAICSIMREMPTDPASVLCLAPCYFNSMAWTLEAAGIASAGPAGRLRAKGLGLIYLGALRVWAGDDTEDQARTLAFLDRRLRQAERLVKWVPDGSGFARRRRRPAKSDSQ